jgi:hypothetical protein
VDEKLRTVESPPLGEVYDDADAINRVLDGAEDALGDVAVALGKLVTDPGGSLEGLSQLPQGVVVLLANSPQYLERFKLMTRGEQMRALSHLTVSLLAMRGAAGVTSKAMVGTGRGLRAVSVPALEVMGDGTLAVGRVAVPVGRAVGALGGGPGAMVVLHMANQSV